MNLSNLSKLIISISSTLGLITISNLLFINSADAFSVTFSNGDFDTSATSLSDWTTTGDATYNTEIDGVSPLSGDNQAIITTGYRDGIDGRSDDIGFDFNQSGSDPIDADTLIENNTGSGDLQSFLNLDTNAFSIARSDEIPGFRTPKEGSAIYQDIIVSISNTDVADGTNGFNLNFNWAYLTNDGKSPDFGNQDFSFISITNSPDNTSNGFLDDPSFTSGLVTTLGDSNQSILNPTSNNDFIYEDIGNYTNNNSETLTVTGLSEGTYSYRVGFGVVDVDSYDRSSALLIDNFSAQQVPFDFSPSGGVAIIFTLIGFHQIKRRVKSN